MTGVKKTSTVLADGRELIYYDTADGAVRAPHDPRPLEPFRPTGRMRYDRLRGEWVAIASHRQARTYLPPTDQCPLCPSRAGRQTEIPADDYEVVAFENRFPSFAAPGDPDAGEDGLFLERPAAGRCEVVCFSAEHDLAFWDLSPSRVRTVVEAWADRTLALEALPGVKQVFCFENRGREIGVTLTHPHGQIYAYPFVTPVMERTLRSARAHRDRTGGDLFAELLAAEQQAGDRIVARTDHWTAFVPWAARWPLEVHLYPNRRAVSLPDLTDAERDDFSTFYLDILRRVGALYDWETPYIAAWHQAPTTSDRELAYLHLELFSIRRAPGKLKYLAGSESGMGAFIGDVTPEAGAEALRKAL
jgi:UDPglucose--hexose-1-phosphate uridylyltransferase